MIGLGAGRRPRVPSGSVDDVRHSSILEHNTSIITPWATEIVRTSRDRVAGSSLDVGLVDHIPAVVVGCAARGGDCAVASGEDTDVTAIEPSLGGLSEDEVNGTLDVGLGIELNASFGQDGVLETIESTSVVALLLRRR